MNGKVSTGDKLGFKYYTYFSIFTIGNTLLAASYLLAKPQWRTIPRVPPLLFGVMFVAYMGYFDWEAKVFVHRLEVERNETAYYFRRLLLDKLANHPNIKPRVARL